MTTQIEKEKTLHVFNINNIRVNLLPFFIQHNETEEFPELFHPDVNHHGTNLDSVTQLKKLIHENKFEKMDEMYLHFVKTSFVQEETTTELLKLHNFNKYNYHGTIGYQLIFTEEQHKQLYDFLHKINDLNMFKFEDQFNFIKIYNDIMCSESSIFTKCEKIKEEILSPSTAETDNTKSNYIRLVNKFKANCNIRIGVVEGLHRVHAIMLGLFEIPLPNFQSTYYSKKIPVTMTAMKTPEDNEQISSEKVLSTLYDISKDFEEGRKINNSTTSIDILRKIYNEFQKKNLWSSDESIVSKCANKEVDQFKKLVNRPEIFMLIRQYITTKPLCDTFVTAIANDPRFKSIKQLKKDNLTEQEFQNYTQTVPCLATWFSGDKFESSVFCTKFQFKNRLVARLKASSEAIRHTACKSCYLEHNLADLFLQAILDTKFRYNMFQALIFQTKSAEDSDHSIQLPPPPTNKPDHREIFDPAAISK